MEVKNFYKVCQITVTLNGTIAAEEKTMKIGTRWLLAFGMAAVGVIGGAGGVAAMTAEDAGYTITSHEDDDEGSGKGEEGKAGEKSGKGDSDKSSGGDSSDKADDDSSDAGDTDGPGDDEDD